MKLRNYILMIALLILGFSQGLSAAEYDIKEMTPEIQNALNGRQARYGQLQELKASGVLGENNQGLVKVLKEIPGANEVTSAENADRQVIYNAIAEQNGLGAAGLPKIQQVFAEVQREKARSGDFVQLPTGEWIKK